MPRLKSERHHWWPECVSAHWADEKGFVHWLMPNGEERYAPPKNFGVIGNGHQIKLGQHPNEETPWDTSYESEFQAADNNFPSIISWLKSLNSSDGTSSDVLPSRFRPVAASENDIAKLVACTISLAIRSPMNREAAVSLAEHLRGPLSEKERNSLIGANMHRDYRKAVESIGTSGKFVVVYSPRKEFIYGDGFYSTIRSPIQSLNSAKMFVPITPNIGVLFSRPMKYTVIPKLFSLEITADEASGLNVATQVYARNAIYYRSEKPEIITEFACEKHLQFGDSQNPVDNLMQFIPGVAPRNTSFGFFGVKA